VASTTPQLDSAPRSTLSSGNFHVDPQTNPDFNYWLDFTDPEVSQVFKNRANNSYVDAVNGFSNHSDFQDLQFNFVQGFIMRKGGQMITIPRFTFYEDMDVNFVYILKIKMRKVNHWAAGGEDFKLLEYVSNTTGNVWMYARMNKFDYGTPVRQRMSFPGWGWNELCYMTISPANELGESAEQAFHLHALRPNYFRSATEFKYTCQLDYPTWTRKNSAGYSTCINAQFMIGGYSVVFARWENDGTPAAKNYFLPISTTNKNIVNPYRNAQIQGYFQMLVRELIITTGQTHTSPSYLPSAKKCKQFSSLLLGTDITDMPVSCAQTIPGDPAPPTVYTYKNYHEAAMCIQDPPTADFIDCAHDMNSVGSNCYRCKRYYGKSGTNACFLCYDNCLECTGPNNDQCTYCGMGYGFTGISCKQCGDDETWDLTKNLCQLKKKLFLEMDYELDSFGEVKLYFVPLEDYADLSLYYEYMFDKFWLIDINRNYIFSRTYTDLGQHRKVSLSFELLSIDTRHFECVAYAVDKVYLGSLFWNLEDREMNVTTPSYWGYGYLDMLPSKFVYTIYHKAPTMVFELTPFFYNDWATVWLRELNVTFFGCFEACSDCWEDNSPVHCLACNPGYYFTNFMCKACSPQCRLCVNSPDQCTGCPTTQVLLGSSCIAGCGLGYYADASAVCQSCPPTCIQCNSYTNCITCTNGNYLDGTNMCVACHASCKTCGAGTSSDCMSCFGTNLLQAGVCIAGPSCSPGFYLVGTTCNPCPVGCATCDSLTCLTCSAGYKMKGKVCANNCGIGWYDAGVNCQPCKTECLTCTTGTACTQCKPGYTTAACIPCTSPCLTCSGSATACTACVPGSGFYLQKGANDCVAPTACIAGTYAEVNNVCTDCQAPCSTCVDFPDKCTSCPAGLGWNNYKCLAICPAGQAIRGTTCCDASCSACNQDGTCTACMPAFWLQTSTQTCPACDPNCATCQFSATYCLTCPAGMLMQSHKCVATCSDGYYKSGSNCLPCDVSCKTCTGPGKTDCTICNNLYVPWNGLCNWCSNSNPDFDTSRFEEKGGKCWEKCGIAGKLSIDDVTEGLGGYKACDDGNLISGDGCSAYCTVEKNYNCVGGKKDVRDYCYPLTKPSAEIVPINNSTDFQIIFSRKINFRDLTDPTNTTKVPFPLSLTIDKIDPAQYTVVWTTPKGDFIDYVNFTIKPKETLTDVRVTVFFERTVIADMYNNTLTNIKLRTTTTIVVPKRFSLEAVISGVEMGNRVSSILVPASSLGITNYVLQSFIRYMMTFQIIGAGIFYNVEQTSTVTLLLSESARASEKALPSPSKMMKSKLVVDRNDSYVDPRLRTYTRVLQTSATGVNASSVPKVFAKNMTMYSKMYDTSDAPTPFKRNGYTNSLITNLSFSIIIILATAIWYFLANAFLVGKVTVKDNCFKRFIAFNGERSFYVAMIFGSLELSLFSTNNILNPRFDHIGFILSFIVSLFAFVICLMLPVILYKIANHEPITLWHPEYYERYAFLYCEFKLNSKLSKCFMAVIMTRIVLFGIFAAALITIPLGQTVVLLLIHIVYFSVLVKTKPFVSKVMLVLTVIAEVFVIASAFCFVISALDNSKHVLKTEKQKEMLDLINCFFICMAILFTLLGILMMVNLKLIQCIKKIQSKKKYQQISPVSSSSAKENHENLQLKVPDQKAGDQPQQAKELAKESANQPKEGNGLLDPDEDFLNSGGKKQNPQNVDDFDQEFLANAEGRGEVDDDAF
jgi:hypothetical protein